MRTSIESNLEAVTDEWDALADRLGVDVFGRPGWTSAWWRWFGGRGQLRVVTVRDGGDLVAVAPLVWRRGAARYPANIHTPTSVAPAVDAEARARLVDALLGMRPRRLVLPLLDRDDPFTTEIARPGSGYRPLVVARDPSPMVPIGGFDDPLELLGSKTRSNVRRRRRRLEEMGTLTIETVRGLDERGSDGLRSILDECLAIEARQWKGEAGTAITTSPALVGFYREITQVAARCRALRLVLIRLDGRIVAFAFGVGARRVNHSLKRGSDPDLARFGLGHLVIAEQLAQARADGVEEFRFLGAVEPYKVEWTDRLSERVGLVMIDRRPRGLPSLVGYRLVRPVRRRLARRLPSGLRIAPPEL